MSRTLRTAAVAEMHISENPGTWLLGLEPVARSLKAPVSRHPAWLVDVLKSLDVDRAFSGGPALVLSRAVLEDLGQVVLDLRRIGTKVAGGLSPELSASENRILAEACSTGHIEVLRVFEALERPILKLVEVSRSRAEADTRPEG